MSEQLLIEVVDEDRLRLTGELDMATADALIDALAEPAAARRVVVIDVAGLTFIDSSGLRGLLAARRAGADIRLSEPAPHIVRLLELAGVADLFPSP